MVKHPMVIKRQVSSCCARWLCWRELPFCASLMTRRVSCVCCSAHTAVRASGWTVSSRGSGLHPMSPPTAVARARWAALSGFPSLQQRQAPLHTSAQLLTSPANPYLHVSMFLLQGGNSNHVQTNLLHLVRFAPPNLGRGAKMTVGWECGRLRLVGSNHSHLGDCSPASLTAKLLTPSVSSAWLICLPCLPAWQDGKSTAHGAAQGLQQLGEDEASAAATAAAAAAANAAAARMAESACWRCHCLAARDAAFVRCCQSVFHDAAMTHRLR